MIWFILYEMVAALATAALSWGTLKLERFDTLVPAVICGILWPVAAPIYGAYLAAIWFSERR